MDFNGLKHHSDKVILAKVTSRERPEVLRQTIQKYIDLAHDLSKMVWLFSCDIDDKKTADVCESFNLSNKHIFIGDSDNKIDAINRDIISFNRISYDKQQTFPKHWDILLNISDDQIPMVKGYDEIIRRSMPNDLDASLWFHDGWQNRINTQEIVGRKYYERFNYIYNPLYKSFFCDNESTEVAKRLGKSIYTNKCIIKHFHPGWNAQSHIKKDALYIRNDKYWREDEDTFNLRQIQNFGL